MIEKAKQFVSTVTSGRASDELYQKRLRICESNMCGVLRKDGEKLYCGACGCPKWSLSELHAKLRFAGATCPKGLWGEAAVAGDAKPGETRMEALLRRLQDPPAPAGDGQTMVPDAWIQSNMKRLY